MLLDFQKPTRDSEEHLPRQPCDAEGFQQLQDSEEQHWLVGGV